MSTNEAPERIYCESDGLGNIVKVHNIKWPDDEAENIEYTRTDAFIEKACEYLQKNMWRIICEENEFRQRFVTDFKNYMKGE